MSLRPGLLSSTLFFLLAASALCSDGPAGFFVNDLSQHPPVPAFFNSATGKLEPLILHAHYRDFIDVVWDAERSRVFFSAHEWAGQPFRIFMKEGLGGAEQPIYESPVGPFKFLLSPDGERLALQVMGPSAWPILVMHDWHAQHSVNLGQGFSPDWSPDSSRLLYLRIFDALPAHLWEYQVQADTTLPVIQEPVVEASYAQDADQFILKTVERAKRCDMFETYDRRTRRRKLFSGPTLNTGSKKCFSQRELAAFPGHQLFVFKEADLSAERGEEMLVVANGEGGRLLQMDKGEWTPDAVAMDPTTLVVGDEPLYLLHADGAGGKQEIPGAAYIRPGS